MENLFDYADEFGPAKIIHVYEPGVDLKAVLVVDNIAKGPSIGGIRIATDVSTTECVRLARAMTWKNAAAGLPHGGGKIVVYGDPRMPVEQKQARLRALAKSLRATTEYIFAPDMGTDEECMAWIKDEVGRVVGLPREIGGIPLDELGATGWGLRHVIDVALEFCPFTLADARVVIQGFGAVGTHTARFLAENGARIIAVADSRGALFNASGLDIPQLRRWKASGKPVSEFPGGEAIDQEDLIGLECEVWIPAARPDVIHADNVERLNTRLLVEGANIPVTSAAETILHEKGILYVPDFIANAGGVICAAMEYHGAGESAAFATIEDKIRRNTRQVISHAREAGIQPREAAMQMAQERVRKAMGFRRFSLFSSAPDFV